MSKKTYIIKAYEEEMGEDFFTVTVPEGTPEEEVKANFEKAERFSGYGSLESDEFTEEQKNYRDNTNGLDAFQSLLIECGYEIGVFEFDYMFEW